MTTRVFTRSYIDVAVGHRTLRFYTLSLKAVRTLAASAQAGLPPAQELDVALGLLAASTDHKVTPDELAELLTPMQMSELLEALTHETQT